MEVKCNFGTITSKSLAGKFYSCVIKHQIIPEDQDLIKFIGEHEHEKTNNDVQCLKFINCLITKVPQGLTKVFPNLTSLNVSESKLKKIVKNDLIEYKNLKRFICELNELEFLPGDLFEGFEDLEWIGFWKNKLKVIEPNILDGLKKLKLLNLSKNVNYNKLFAIYPNYKSTITLDAVRDHLYEKFFSVDRQTAVNFMDRLQHQASNSAQQKLPTKSSLSVDLTAFIQNDTNKDFKVVIGSQEFPIHKFLLAARSPTLAELLKNNPQAEDLKLSDVSAEIFEIILKFLYTDELPGDDGTDFLQIFAAAGKLKIKELENYAADKVIDQIDGINAIDIFRLGCKYKNYEMKQKAVNKIKEKYPKMNFMD
ncbi:hypothetical protein ACKWTF_015266 [Chironomus riparius]